MKKLNIDSYLWTCWKFYAETDLDQAKLQQNENEYHNG